jgi:hypothetical protein
MQKRYGAIIHGRQATYDANATVEFRTAGVTQFTLLCAVQGDLATASIESIKGALSKTDRADEDAAKRLVSSAPPPPFASGVAVVLLTETDAIVAMSGSGGCYRAREGVLAKIDAGAHALQAGDIFLAVSDGALIAGSGFLSGGPLAHGGSLADNAQLDGALEAAVARVANGFVAVAATQVEHS